MNANVRGGVFLKIQTGLSDGILDRFGYKVDTLWPVWSKMRKHFFSTTSREVPEKIIFEIWSISRINRISLPGEILHRFLSKDDKVCRFWPNTRKKFCSATPLEIPQIYSN